MGQNKRDVLNPKQTQLLEEIIENLEGNEEFDYNTLFDELKYYLKRPLNLNEATEEDLDGLYLLNDFQIGELLDYRIKNGNLISVLELQSIPSFDMATIRNIQAFVTVNESLEDFHYPITKMLVEGDNDLFIKYKRVLEEQLGYTDLVSENSRYEGDQNKYYLRYNHNFENRLQYGFTAEKDAGESFFEKSNPNGFDYYSAHFFLRNINRHVKAIAIGDYAVSLGQGLLIHNQFGASKSSSVMDIKKGGRTIRPYTSVNEINYFRGAASSIQISDRFKVTAFASSKKVDGRLLARDTLEQSGFGEFSSIIDDGFHRNNSEISREKTVLQQSVGGQIKFEEKRFKLGVNGLYEKFDNTFNRSDQLYNLFVFRGNKIWNISLDYTLRLSNFHFFGESARSDNNAYAHVHGLMIGIDPKLAFSVLYRSYDADYQAINANAFAESSSPVNEKGVYLGLELRPNKYWTISSYADFWKHPWLKFRRDAPSTGQEYLFKVNYYRKRELEVYAQYKFEEKSINNSSEAAIDQLTQINLHRLRFHVTYLISKSVSLRNRVEFSFFKKDGEHSRGFLIYQDIAYKPIEEKLSFTARFSLFDTDNFDTRIYTYENDIINEFFIPFYQNRGMRYYFNIRYDWNYDLTTELRFSQTHLENKSVIGSSTEAILGPKKSEIKAQIIYSF
jgi:hypothetical protein